MSTLLKQAQPTFGELAGNGKTYEVPSFQRDYSWEKEEWEDLWLDLIAIDKEDSDHYMGYLVLQETKQSKHFIIIDGQQRITTISLLVLSTVKYLMDKGDIDRASDLKNTYLVSKDIATRIDVPKLKLNYNNEYIYGKLLDLNLPNNIFRFKPSEKKLINAFNFFYKNIKNEFSSKTTEDITAFITKRVDVKLFFTSITVKDDLNAFNVFETLNARGVKLSTADLLKNFLFSIIYSPTSGSISHEEKKWHRINDVLEKTDVTTFLRHFWNSQHFPTERKSTLFKTIKKEIKQQSDAIKLLHDLDDHVGIYASLSKPTSDVWTNEQSILIEELNILEVSQCYGLLMTAKIKFSEIEFNKILRDIVAISFRYNTIGGQNPNELERIYGKASVSIFKGELNTSKSVFEAYLKEAYLDDNAFKNDFQNKSINTQKYNGLVKYILSKLEIQYGGTEPEINSKSFSVEHILPENPNEYWANEFSDSDIENYIYRIGNLTILEGYKNKEADRKSFKEKSKIYSTSNYKLTDSIHFEEWNVKSIVTRQRDMANKASTIWKINY